MSCSRRRCSSAIHAPGPAGHTERSAPYEPSQLAPPGLAGAGGVTHERSGSRSCTPPPKTPSTNRCGGGPPSLRNTDQLPAPDRTLGTQPGGTQTLSPRQKRGHPEVQGPRGPGTQRCKDPETQGPHARQRTNGPDPKPPWLRAGLQRVRESARSPRTGSRSTRVRALKWAAAPSTPPSRQAAIIEKTISGPYWTERWSTKASAWS